MGLEQQRERLNVFVLGGMTLQDIRVSSWRGEWTSIWQVLSLTEGAH